MTALFYNTAHLPARGIPFPDESWTTDDLIDAFDFMRSLIYERQITPAPQGCSGYNLANGTISMELQIYARNASLAAANMDAYDVALVPKSPSGKRFTTAVPNGWVINAASSPEAQEAAWRWIKFQIGEKAQLIRMTSGSGVMVNRNVSPTFLAEPGPPAHREVFLESYAFADTLEENAVWGEYRNAITAALTDFWNNKVSAQEALLNAHQQVSSILAQVYKK